MRRFLPVLLALALAFVPALGFARPGQGLSLGSRGSHTWSATPGTSSAPGGAYSFQRSLTPNGGSTYYGSRSYGASGFGYGGYGGYGYRSSFTSGLLGGLIGAGLGGLLFGRGFFGFHGGSGFLGLILQLFLLYLLARWLFRRFGAGLPATAAGPGFFARGMFGPPRRPGFGLGGTAQRPLSLASSDYQAFSQILQGIQAAWSNHDTDRLRAMATPEMVGYFAEQMAEQASRGVRNQVFNVQLQQGDLSEAWSEGNRDYATVSMRFSMIDVTRDSAGRVVDGSLTERVTVTEFWTFLRSSGGHWILSAIQQAR